MDKLKQFKKVAKGIERAQKKVSRTGKDKSLLRSACLLGFICNKAPIRKGNNLYVNPHTSGDKLYLEGINPIEYVEFINNEFYDSNNKLVYIDTYYDKERV
jgi:hypothetical protein